MPRLVGGLGGEQLHHLAEVRVQLAEQPRRDDQRRLLVLDEVGHELHDGALDLVRNIDVRGPVHRRRWVPLTRGRGRVQPGGDVGPDVVAFGPFGADGRAAGFDERAAGGQAPARVGAFVRRAVRRAGPFRVAPALLAGRALDDLHGAGVAAGGAGLGVGG
jgi:hypothetical protein